MTAPADPFAPSVLYHRSGLWACQGCGGTGGPSGNCAGCNGTGIFQPSTSGGVERHAEMHGSRPRSGPLTNDPNVREWRLVIPGEPVAKARPRFRQIKTATKEFVSTYTPKKTAKYEDTIRYAAQREWNRDPLRGVAIFARIVAYRSIPSSLSKSKFAAAIDGTLRPTTRPDHDNYSKIVCDALNKIVFDDDAAIVDCWTSKMYGTQPRVEIILSW